MVKATDGWPHELLYNAIWQISHSWTNSLFELMDVICAPALSVYFPFDICKQILYRAYFWHVCRIVSFCNYGDVVFRKPVLDRVSIMRGRQVGPKYILTSTMIFSKEWHQSIFNTLFQVDVLVDGLFTRRNVNLTSRTRRPWQIRVDDISGTFGRTLVERKPFALMFVSVFLFVWSTLWVF